LKRILRSLCTLLASLRPDCVALVVLGSFIQALGVSSIHAFSHVTEGGTLGLELLLYHWLGISPTISSILLNGICYAIGWRVLGCSFLAYSGIAVGIYSLSYALLEPVAPLWPGLITSPLACAVLGAVFVGLGAGISMLGGGAPGGDDALAMSLNKHFGWSVEHVYLVSDLSVLLLSLSYIPAASIACSLVTVTLSSFIIGKIHTFGRKNPEN
jgi:uncharacterized membrane-anchored protein YitT (DUF2179 family)